MRGAGSKEGTVNAGEDRRRFPRCARVGPPTERGDAGASQPLLINVSPGGVCLWVREPPPTGRPYTLHWQREGRETVVPLQLVWLRPCRPVRGTEPDQAPQGWLAGFAVAPAPPGAPRSTHPPDLPVSGPLEVVSPVEPDRPASPNEASVAGTYMIFPEAAVPAIRAVAESLLPILARHFTEARLVLTRDRLEIVAPFRPLAEGRRPQDRGPGRRVLPAGTETLRVAPPEAAQPAAAGRLARARGRGRPGRVLLASAGLLAVVLLAWQMLPPLRQSDPAPVAATGVRPLHRALPPWAAPLAPSSPETVDQWRDIQGAFGLPNALMAPLLRVLQANDRYPSSHMLHDLTAYPMEVGRAFRIVAGAGATGRPALGPLTKDLGMRLVTGARFPDEPAGDRHLLLDAKLDENAVVLAILELLSRRHDDPAVQQVLTALRGPSPSPPQPRGRGDPGDAADPTQH